MDGVEIPDQSGGGEEMSIEDKILDLPEEHPTRVELEKKQNLRAMALSKIATMDTHLTTDESRVIKNLNKQEEKK